MITQIVSAATVRGAVEYVVAPALASKALTAEHCDQMLSLCASTSWNRSTPMSKACAEYVSNRVTLHDLVFEQGRLRREWESFGNPVSPSIVAEVAEPLVHSMLAGGGAAPLPVETNQADASLRSIADLDARIARTTPQELAEQVEKLNDLYRGLLGLAGAPFLERIRKSSDVPRAMEKTDIQTRVVKSLASPALTEYTRTIARAAGGFGLPRDSSRCGGGSLRTTESCHRRLKPPRRLPDCGRFRSIRIAASRSDLRSLTGSRRSIPLGRMAGMMAGSSITHGHPIRVTCS